MAYQGPNDIYGWLSGVSTGTVRKLDNGRTWVFRDATTGQNLGETPKDHTKEQRLATMAPPPAPVLDPIFSPAPVAPSPVLDPLIGSTPLTTTVTKPDPLTAPSLSGGSFSSAGSFKAPTPVPAPVPVPVPQPVPAPAPTRSEAVASTAGPSIDPDFSLSLPEFQPRPEPVDPVTLQPRPEPVAPVTLQPRPEPVAPVTLQPQPDEALPPVTLQPRPEPVAPVTLQPQLPPVPPVTLQPQREPVAPVILQPQPDEALPPVTLQPQLPSVAPVTLQPRPVTNLLSSLAKVGQDQDMAMSVVRSLLSPEPTASEQQELSAGPRVRFKQAGSGSAWEKLNAGEPDPSTLNITRSPVVPPRTYAVNDELAGPQLGHLEDLMRQWSSMDPAQRQDYGNMFFAFVRMRSPEWGEIVKQHPRKFMQRVEQMVSDLGIGSGAGFDDFIERAFPENLVRLGQRYYGGEPWNPVTFGPTNELLATGRDETFYTPYRPDDLIAAGNPDAIRAWEVWMRLGEQERVKNWGNDFTEWYTFEYEPYHQLTGSHDRRVDYDPRRRRTSKQ
jgi:hypothetical protein